MSTVLLVRHGLTALTGPVLAGHTPGLHLDERGQKQADAVAARIAVLPLAAIVTSPLDRCLDTAEAIAAAQQTAGHTPAWHVDERIIECRYGTWTGRPIKELAREPMWKVVQGQPSAARFPDGESLPEVSARAVEAVREWDATLGPDAIWVACSHGDVIKAILADALGLHLDQFQRIVVDPCSVSLVRYTDARPYVLRANDIGADLSPFVPPKRRAHRRPARPAMPPTRRSAADREPEQSDPEPDSLDGPCPGRSSSSTIPGGSSSVPSACPAIAPSTCRRSTARGSCRSRWRRRRCRCSPTGSSSCSTTW